MCVQCVSSMATLSDSSKAHVQDCQEIPSSNSGLCNLLWYKYHITLMFLAAGSVCAGNLQSYLPFILSEIHQNPKRQYLLLHSLKEIITCHYVSTESMAVLEPHVAGIWWVSAYALHSVWGLDSSSAAVKTHVSVVAITSARRCTLRLGSAVLYLCLLSTSISSPCVMCESCVAVVPVRYAWPPSVCTCAFVLGAQGCAVPAL